MATQRWNEGPSFSWANTLLALAIIVMVIGTYMHGFYVTGDYLEAALAASILPPIPDLVFTLLTLVLFLAIQFLKGTSSHFAKRLRWERALAAISLPLLAVSLMPVNYTLLVLEDAPAIRRDFAEGVKTFEGLFGSYDKYCEERLKCYATELETHRDDLGSPFAKDNYLLTLRLQLYPSTEDFNKMKKASLEWIKDNEKNPSVWNPFLVANTDIIIDGIRGWADKLNKQTEHHLHNELQTYPQFVQSTEVVKRSAASFSKVKDRIRKQSGVSLHILWLGLLLYLLLLSPYLLQQRHTKARGYYSFFRVRKARRSPGGMTLSPDEEGVKEASGYSFSLTDDDPGSDKPDDDIRSYKL